METLENIKELLFETTDSDAQNIPTLMIVDDNVEIIEALRSVLKNHYIIVSALSFEEAREKLTQDIRVVILDIKMASKDGIEAFQLLKQENETLRIIFHSAYPGSEEKAQQARDLPHDGYLTKGEYSTPELLDTIRKAMAT